MSGAYVPPLDTLITTGQSASVWALRHYYHKHRPLVAEVVHSLLRYKHDCSDFLKINRTALIFQHQHTLSKENSANYYQSLLAMAFCEEAIDNILANGWSKSDLIIHLTDVSLYYALVSRKSWKNLPNSKSDERYDHCYGEWFGSSYPMYGHLSVRVLSEEKTSGQVVKS